VEPSRELIFLLKLMEQVSEGGTVADRARALDAATKRICELISSTPDPSADFRALGLVMRAAKVFGNGEGIDVGVLLDELQKRLQKIENQTHGRDGVPKSKATRRANRAEKWESKGKAVAREYIDRHLCYDDLLLARRIIKELEGRGPRTERGMKEAIARWRGDGEILPPEPKPPILPKKR
jgi:hypothetical protein